MDIRERGLKALSEMLQIASLVDLNTLTPGEMDRLSEAYGDVSVTLREYAQIDRAQTKTV